MPMRGISQFSIENLLSHSTEEHRRGTLLCFHKISGIEKRGGGREGVSRFSVNIFCLIVPKNFVGEPFCAVFQKISGGQKVYG